MSKDRWNHAMLESYRAVGDPIADPVIAHIFANHEVDIINRMLVSIEENDHIVPAEMPDAIEVFLNQTDDWPTWADREQIRLGQQLFSRYGMQMALALFFWSLPSCYACAKGARVLAWTRRIDAQVHRRLIETAQFLIDVMAEGGLERDGYGVRTAQKIRLLHATIRYFISRDPKWQAADWGVPINQEDMAGTLLSFALLPRVLTKVELDFSRDEENAFFHCWMVIGHILGVDPTLMPRDLDDAQVLWDTILARHVAPSEAGHKLTKALVDYTKERIPGEMFDGLPAVLVRELCGDTIANALGLEKAGWTRRLLGPMRLLFEIGDELQDHSKLGAKLTGAFSRTLLNGLHTAERGKKRVTFRIPRSLQDSWGLDAPSSQ